MLSHAAIPSCIFAFRSPSGRAVPCRHARAGLAAEKNGEKGVIRTHKASFLHVMGLKWGV